MLENAVTRVTAMVHHEGGFQFGGYRQCGTDAQHLQGDGVIGDEQPPRASPLSYPALFSHYSALLTNFFQERTRGPIRPSKIKAMLYAIGRQRGAG